ncbi:MAG: phosphotransferase [Candidatus Latescibacteria bacterium]|nr:phosphotransferase [Candidatus Latescibacterota bacterium]
MSEHSVETCKRALGNRYFPDGEMAFVGILPGEDSENFLVEAAGCRYVLKWYAEADGKSLGEELAAMQWLRGRGVPVPAVVPDRAGGLLAEVDGARAVLLEFIEGDAPGDEFATGLQIAQFLAKFHRESSAFKGEFCAERTEFARLAAFAAACRADPAWLAVDGMAGFIVAYGEEVALYKTALEQGGGAQGIIHHDLHPGNFLVAAGEIAAILDFSEAHRAPLIFDLAVLLGYWAFDADRGRLDLGKCCRLLTAYAATRPIPPAEMVLLPHAVLIYFATDATGYILPRLRDRGAVAISQCNMYRWFCALRQERGWIDELSGVF